MSRITFIFLASLLAIISPHRGMGFTTDTSARMPRRHLPVMKASKRSFLSPKANQRQETNMHASAVAMMPGSTPSPVYRVFDAFHNLPTKVRGGISEVTMWRTAAAISLALIVLFRSSIDNQLAVLWSWLQNSNGLFPRMFRHDCWEGMLGGSAFLVWIHGFWFADKAVSRAASQGRVHPWRKFRLQDRYESQKLQYRLKRKSEKGEDVDMNQQPPLVTEHTEWSWKSWVSEFPLYVIPLLVADMLFPRRAANIARWAAPTTFQVCRDVTGALLIFDLLFFCGHYFMHKIPFLFKHVHKEHHTHSECRAVDSLIASSFEGILEVVFAFLSLNFLKCHPVARSLFYVVLTFLLTELHCGFDFPWTPQNVVPFGLATGSRRHHYHHRFGHKYYQAFFCHVDRLFGHTQKDDGSLLGETVKLFETNVPTSWR